MQKRELDRDLLKHWILKANLAPSAHNTQPARVEIVSLNHIRLWGDSNSWLKFGDPSGRDHLKSIGAFYEGLKIAASEDGYSLLASEVSPVDFFKSQHLVAEIEVKTGADSTDELAQFVNNRISFRGSYKKVDRNTLDSLSESGLDALSKRLERLGTFGRVVDQDAVAELFDRANVELFRDPNFLIELKGWMRMKSSHPEYLIDGLNRESMALNIVEALAVPTLFKPSVMSFLNQLKLTKTILTEAPKNKSAAAILYVVGSRDLSAFESGRIFYRGWLSLTASQLFGCPLSALLDVSAAKQQLLESESISDSQDIFGIWRMGYVDSKKLAYKARGRRAIENLMARPLPE